MQSIIAEVCEQHGLAEAQLVGNQKNASVVLPRQEAYWRMYHEAGATVLQIARRMGHRDHTTISHGIAAHADRMGAGMTAKQFNDRIRYLCEHYDTATVRREGLTAVITALWQNVAGCRDGLEMLMTRLESGTPTRKPKPAPDSLT